MRETSATILAAEHMYFLPHLNTGMHQVSRVSMYYILENSSTDPIAFIIEDHHSSFILVFTHMDCFFQKLQSFHYSCAAHSYFQVKSVR